MDTGGCLEGVQASVVEVATQELVGEALRAGVIFGRKILLAGLGWSVWHVWGAIEKAAHVESVLRVFNLISSSRELSGSDALLLDGLHSCFDFVVNGDIEFSVLSHLLENFMFISLQWVFQSDISLSLR
jgi:hypothetical protein